MDREEVYHRMHAQMWAERLSGDERFEAAVDELWPYAVAVLPESLRPALSERVGRPLPSNGLLLTLERGGEKHELRELHAEMTMVRRSVRGATW